mmetsp:Transcript_26549/g.47236  ORF Transcript_26549/g.47236 Transcript_26549/m.47236 type:complete len:165 (-) Transcript_26549:218-712(-)
MALRQFACTAVSSLGLRAAVTPSLALSGTASGLFGRAFATVAEGFKYATSHEYVNVEGDVATVGISDFAQAELGDVVYVELPDVGSTVTKGEGFGVVESVKAASDVYAPVSGEVIATNDSLADDPSKVNSDSFGEGWLMKVKMSDSGEVDSLLDSAAYAKQCEE